MDCLDLKSPISFSDHFNMLKKPTLPAVTSSNMMQIEHNSQKNPNTKPQRSKKPTHPKPPTVLEAPLPNPLEKDTSSMHYTPAPESFVDFSTQIHSQTQNLIKLAGKKKYQQVSEKNDTVHILKLGVMIDDEID